MPAEDGQADGLERLDVTHTAVDQHAGAPSHLQECDYEVADHGPALGMRDVDRDCMRRDGPEDIPDLAFVRGLRGDERPALGRERRACEAGASLQGLDLRGNPGRRRPRP